MKIEKILFKGNHPNNIKAKWATHEQLQFNPHSHTQQFTWQANEASPGLGQPTAIPCEGSWVLGKPLPLIHYNPARQTLLTHILHI